jgi:hypothetical protein
LTRGRRPEAGLLSSSLLNFAGSRGEIVNPPWRPFIATQGLLDPYSDKRRSNAMRKTPHRHRLRKLRTPASLYTLHSPTHLLLSCQNRSHCALVSSSIPEFLLHPLPVSNIHNLTGEPAASIYHLATWVSRCAANLLCYLPGGTKSGSAWES